MGDRHCQHEEDRVVTVSGEAGVCLWSSGLSSSHTSLSIKYSHLLHACVCVCIMAVSSSVVFEIEVLSFVDSSAVNQYQSYSKEEKDRISIDQLLQVANTEREVRIYVCIASTLHKTELCLTGLLLLCCLH